MEINSTQFKKSESTTNYIKLEKAIDKSLTTITELQEKIIQEEKVLRELIHQSRKMEIDSIPKHLAEITFTA